MAEQFGERPRRLALAVTADLRHRDLEVVIKQRQRHPAKECERRHLPIEKRFRRLTRISLHDPRIRLRQVHAEKVDLLAHPTDDGDRLAEIHLAVPGWMRQRHDGLATPRAADTDVMLHHSVAAAKAMHVASPLKNPLRRMPLLHRQQQAQLWLRGRLLTRVPRPQREPAHLQHRLTAQPKKPALLRGGCDPRRIQIAGQRRRLPRQTLRPPPPKGTTDH